MKERREWGTYIVKVRNPETGVEKVYPNVRAVSEAHADRQGRDGFTGLLGVPDGLQESLEVEVQECPSN